MERRLKLITLTTDVFMMELVKLQETPLLSREKEIIQNLMTHCLKNKLRLDVCNGEYSKKEMNDVAGADADADDLFQSEEWYIGTLTPTQQAMTADSTFLSMEYVAKRLSHSYGRPEEPMRFRVGFESAKPSGLLLRLKDFYDKFAIGQDDDLLHLVFKMDGYLDADGDATLAPEMYYKLIVNDMTIADFLRQGIKSHPELSQVDFNMCLCCFAIAYEKLTREQFILNDYCPTIEQSTVLSKCFKHIGNLLKPNLDLQDADEGFEGHGVDCWFE
jgi:hypothetical protein